ncbi:MAG: hypothetical protein HOK06_05205, partial [Rhodospirillaceae bacterium]|nr:hypothetical protein [Rhodospirillaceae bacterium]
MKKTLLLIFALAFSAMAGVETNYLRTGVLGQWTFDGGSTSAQRLQSSSPAAGVSLSSLAINPDVTDFGNGAVPSGDDAGLGFGGNTGEQVVFWHRANYTNTNAPAGKTPAWGVPGVDAGIDTTVANAPMSFMVTAESWSTLTVEGLLINNSNGDGGCNAHFQEAGQAAGSANGGGLNALAPLIEPVVIAPGTTKTFTINWSGDALDIKQNINRIDLRGTVSSGGALETVHTRFSEAVGQATPPAGWSFHWNAPTNWVAGVEPGDLSSGPVSDTNSWRPMVWGAGMWTADGNSNGADSSPDKYIRIIDTGGHPGAAGDTRELDRYAISVFTVDMAGDYQLGQGWIEKASGSGNGLLVRIFCKGQLVKTVECAAGEMAHLDTRLEGLAVGDQIAVAVGSAGDPGYDSYEMDYELALCNPTFDGLPVFEVASFGAAGDGTTDDYHAIHAAVDAAKDAGGGIVRFESNTTYRVIGDSTDEDVVETVFELEGTYNIKIEGNGSTLLLYPADQLTEVLHSENIQLDGFTVGFDPLPYYQGIVDDINIGNLTMDITVPVRYDVPEMGTNTASANRPFFGRSFIPESPGSRAGTGQHLYIDYTETIGGDPRKVRLHFRDDMTSNLQSSSAATEMVVPHIRYGHRGTHSIVVNKSSRVKISNLLYRNAPFFLCAPVGNTGPVTLSNFDVLTADPANELFVTWRDGYHVKDNHFGVLIEDGDWHGGGMNDDLFNFAHMMKFVTSISSNELSLMAANSFGGQ